MLPDSQPQEKKAGLAYWAQRVLEECDKASAGFAADPVHDLRVAIRRCRSMADGFLSVDPDPAWKQMKRLAKPLFSSLGDLRDTQVMMEWATKLGEPGDPVASSLMAALTEKETELKEAAQRSLASFDRKEWTALNDHLEKRTGKIPLEGLVFQHVALERWMDARALHRHALKNRSGVAYHQLRVGIKRFRYTVENFLPERHAKWSKDLRDLQDALGEVHDFDVLRAIMKTHPEIHPDKRARWLKRISEERQKRLEQYRQKMLGKSSLWNVWRSDLPAGDQLQQSALEKLRTWAAFLDPDTAHSTLVTRLALQLFDGISQCGMLNLTAEQRRILEAAAILHEIGRDKTKNGHNRGHQKRGYRMIGKLKPPVGWAGEDMVCVAALVRHHRGALPTADVSSFVGLSVKKRSELMPLLGMLRLANAFDEAHDRSVTGIRVERRNDSLLLLAEGLQSLSPTAEGVARARYLLESLCNCAIVVRPAAKRASPAVLRARTRRQSATVGT
jgi:CHAD domain-containing protein